MLAFLAGWLLRGRPGRKTDVPDTRKIFEGEKHAIENTPAAILVDAAPDAAGLRASAAGIAGQAKQRFRDRAGEILSRHSNTGFDGSGGS